MLPNSAAYLVILFLLLPFSQTFCQILNVEKSRLEEDSSKYFMGKASLGMNLNNRGVINDQTITFLGINASTDLAYFSKRHTYMLINFYNYISNNGDAFVSAGYSHFRVQLFRKNRLSYETFAQYQYDRPRGLMYRRLLGAGIRYALHKSKSVNLTIGNGLFVEQEGWQSPIQEIPFQDVVFLKSNNYFSIRYDVNENLKLNSIVYYQVGHDRPANLYRQRLSGEANFNVRISRKISMKTTFTSTYENHPIVPVQKFLYTLINGIEVNF